MKQQSPRLLAMQGVRVLSREQIGRIAGGTGNYSVLNFSCECLDGTSFSVADCKNCDSLCNGSHGGQACTSDCCGG